MKLLHLKGSNGVTEVGCDDGFECAHHGLRWRRFREALFGEPDCAQFEACTVYQAISIPHDQLDRSAADINDQRRSVREGDTVLDAEKDEPGFFHPADHTYS